MSAQLTAFVNEQKLIIRESVRDSFTVCKQIFLPDHKRISACSPLSDNIIFL